MNKTILFLLVLWASASSRILLADPAVIPEDILTPEEITDILTHNNFFHYQSIDDETPIWVDTHRKYSRVFLHKRIHSFSNEALLHKLLTDSFPIQLIL